MSKLRLVLRTRGGVPSRWLEQRPNERDEFVALGLLRSRNGNFVLTSAGKLLADTVAEAFYSKRYSPRRNAAGAGRILPRPRTNLLCKVRPEFRRHIHLRVGKLPEKKFDSRISPEVRMSRSGSG